MSNLIKEIKAREILNSNGKPTIEVSLETEKGVFLASVPSGVSKGEQEAVEVPVKEAIQNIEKMNLKGKKFKSQKQLDSFLIKLDGTKNKSRLGGNTTLAVSIAFLRALAFEKRLPLWKYISKIAKTKPALPKPCILLIEGGKHGKGKLSFQEFLFIPEGNSFKEQFEAGKEAYNNVRETLKEKSAGLEGGFVPDISEEEALAIIKKASQKKGKVGIDVAASSFYRPNEGYFFQNRIVSASFLIDFYRKIKEQVVFFEDPFSQNDFTAWKAFNKEALLIGDDLTTTNTERIKKAKGLCSGVIIKPNQIGTVSETIKAFKLAKKFKWKTIVSHRAGETQDSFIADLSCGFGADYIKAGGLNQKERMAKYLRLLEIEKELC